MGNTHDDSDMDDKASAPSEHPHVGSAFVPTRRPSTAAASHSATSPPPPSAPTASLLPPSALAVPLPPPATCAVTPPPPSIVLDPASSIKDHAPPLLFRKINNDGDSDMDIEKDSSPPTMSTENMPNNESQGKLYLNLQCHLHID